MIATKNWFEEGDFHGAKGIPDWMPFRLLDLDRGFQLDVFKASGAVDHDAQGKVLVEFPMPWLKPVGGYEYPNTLIFPVVPCTFDEVVVKCPHQTEAYLKKEYNNIEPQWEHVPPKPGGRELAE